MDSTLHHFANRAFIFATYLQVDEQAIDSVGFERYVRRARRIESALHILQTQ